MSDRETVDFLAAVPLFEGRDRADLAELARSMRRRTVHEGEFLWRAGDEAREMVFVVGGGLAASLRVTGDRTVALGRAGPGEMVGEMALLDGGVYSMSATATATLLALGRVEFAALLARQHPSAFRVKRRLASTLTARLRNQLSHLAESLRDEASGPPSGDAAPALVPLEESSPPDSRYMRRMATFHDFDPLAVWGFLTSGRYARCPPGGTLLAEGLPSTACYMTINGAVEKVMIRGGKRIRLGLAGPGKLFGYAGLIDGLPSPITAIARERALLLVLPRAPFEQLFNAEDAISRVFLDVIQRDLVGTLRQTLPPLTRHLASRPVEAA